MKKPETLIVEKIMLRLQAEGGFWIKIHGGPFQLAGIPDILGCYKGRFIGIEVKCPGEVPTTLQWKMIKLIRKAEGRAWFCTNLEDALAIRDGKK